MKQIRKRHACQRVKTGVTIGRYCIIWARIASPKSSQVDQNYARKFTFSCKTLLFHLPEAFCPIFTLSSSTMTSSSPLIFFHKTINKGQKLTYHIFWHPGDHIRVQGDLLRSPGEPLRGPGDPLRGQGDQCLVSFNSRERKSKNCLNFYLWSLIKS